MNTSERLGVISGSAERKSEHLRWITRGFFLLLLALSISFQIVPQTAYAASTITPDGTYNFGGTLGIDGSGGGGTTAAGFATLGDNKFVVSNRFMNGDLPSPTALWSNDQVVGGAIGSLTIKAAGTKVQTFTFNNLGISTYENVGQSLESITVVLYDIGGSVISTLTSGTGKVINLSNSVSQLGTLINSGAAYNINNVASLKLTWHYNNITVAPSNLNIENITISNVKAAAWTASASAATLTPVAGVDDAVTLTVKNSSGSTDTGFSGARNVTVTGYAGAPDGSYGSFNGTTLSASTSTISVNFTNGVAVPNLKLNKVASQTIGFSVAGVDTPATNTLSLTPTAGSAASMALTTDIIAPASNGGAFAQQPVVTIRDAYGNVRVNDTTTSVTVSRKDAGTWMLTGTATKTASAGVVTFTGLGATNAAAVTNAQLAFDASGLTQLLSSTVNLPAPALVGAWTASASAATLTPVAGVDDAITLTVKNSSGSTDTGFSGARIVTVSGYAGAPDGSYGSFNGTALTASPNTISVNFVNGVAAPNLKLNKAASQTIGFSIAGVNTPATNTLSLTPTVGSAASLALTTDIIAPASNGGTFAQQPAVTLRDAYGNTSVNDNTTSVTVSRKDGGTWTLTGAATKTASAGVVTFTGLGATNAAAVTNAQLAFDASGLTQLLSSTVNLPAPALVGAWTASASAATLTPVAGVDDAITLTVKNSSGSTDTGFSGARIVTVSGYAGAPDGSYGSFNGTALTASPNTISVNFVNGVAAPNLKLNKAASQTIGFSIAGVNTPATNTLSLTPTVGSAASLALTTDITAPTSNGGIFAQQPTVTLRDAYGNIRVNDNATSVTVSRKDAGTWMLTGTATKTASAGVVTFTGLGATNAAAVTNAQLAFDASGLTQLLSSAVNLPAPTGAWTADASAATLTPGVGVDDAMTLTVKDSLGNTDTGFSGARNVTVSGYAGAPDGSYGSFNGTALTASPNTISVNFVNGVAAPNLKLNKAASQTIGFSIAGVNTPATNTLSLTPTVGSAASLALTTDIIAPSSNGGTFAQQPAVTLRDAYGNTRTGDNATVVTVSKKDGGSWTLTGTTTVTASAGVATFSDLGATNAAQVTGAQLAFQAGTLAEITNSTVKLPAPAGAQTATAAAALTPVAGANNTVTLTVKDALGNTDMNFDGDYDVTISGVKQTPNGSYGSFAGTTLTSGSQTISVSFTDGVATPILVLHKADEQTIGFSIAGVANPATNTQAITPSAGDLSAMELTQDITAPAANGGQFAQQPFVKLVDAYGNIRTGDNSTITVAKKDAGNWNLTGTTVVTANAGVATFSGLGATNAAQVTGAQLAFDSSGLAQIASQSVILPWPGVAAPSVESVTTGDSHVLLSWSKVYGSVSYAVYQGRASGTYGDAVATVTGFVYDATGLTNGTTYYFVVKAVNPSGISAASNEVSATPQVTAPGVPVLGPATPGDARISLTWDPVIGSTGYKIFKSTTSGAYGSEEVSVSDSVYGYEVTGLMNGTTYYFVIQATNPGGDSTASNEVSATPRTVPTAPTGVIAVAGNGQATVSFTAPANGGSDITYYEVTAIPGNITVTGMGSPITVTGLSNGVTYTFTVQAVNRAGSSAASDASNSVTLRKPSGSSNTSTPSSTSAAPTTIPDPVSTPGSPVPTVDVFNSSIVNETNLVKTIESKVAEAKEANATIDFADTQGHWAGKTIDVFIKLQLIKGYEDGTFRPNSPITRAEFAAILNRAFNIQGSSNTSVVLKDIGNSWAKEAIENFVAAGVIKGYDDGTFKSDQTITREEMVVILSRIVNLNDLVKDTTKGNFNDLNGSYAASEIQAEAQAGIVSGKGDGKFEPKSNATRAEALQIILNVLELNPQLKKLLDSLS